MPAGGIIYPQLDGVKINKDGSLPVTLIQAIRKAYDYAAAVQGSGVGATGPQGPTGPAGAGGATGATGPAGGGVGTPAPPIASGTAEPYYERWGNLYNAGITGTINLPTTDPDYGFLVQVSAFATSPSGDTKLLATFTNWGLAASLTYANIVELQPYEADEDWSVSFVGYNIAGAPTSAFTISPVTIKRCKMTSISAAEVPNSTYQDLLAGLHIVVEVSPVMDTPVYPVTVAIWFDMSDGRGWVHQGLFVIYEFGGTIRIGDPINPTRGFQMAGTIMPPTQPANVHWKVAGCVGPVNDENVDLVVPPPVPVQHNFDVNLVGAPAPDDCHDIQMLPDPDTGDVLVYAQDSFAWKWHWYEIDWWQPTKAKDPYYWLSFITIQFGREVGGVWEPAPDWTGSNDIPDVYLGRRMTDSLELGGSGDKTLFGSLVQMIGDHPPKWDLPPDYNVDGTPNLYKTGRLRVYAVSRQGTDESGGVGATVLQTGWPGGADHFDVNPVSPGPVGNARHLNPGISFNPAGPLTGGGGAPIEVHLALPLSVLSNEIGMHDKAISQQWLADGAVIARTLNINAVNAATGALAVNAVIDGLVKLPVNQLIAGSAIFTGDVGFSRGSSQPIVLIRNTGIFLYGVANGSGTDGLTSQPFVSIANTGIGVYANISGPSVVISSLGGVTVYSVNGNTSQPYLAVSSGAIQIVDGTFRMDLSSSQLKMDSGLGAYAVVSSAGFRVISGTQCVRVTAGFVQLWASWNDSTQTGNTSAPFIGLESSTGRVFIGVSTRLVTFDASSITIDMASTKLIMNSGSIVMTVPGTTVPVVTISGSGTDSQIDLIGRSSPSSAYAGNFDVYVSSAQSQLTLSGGTPGGGFNASIGMFCVTNTPRIEMNGTQVIGTRQTGPGNASGWSDPTAQTWANSLLIALRNHGLIT